MTDEALFDRVRSGDDAAFRTLYERYRAPLFRFAWRLTIRNKDAVPHQLQARIEFQDHDGFVVDEDDEYGLTVPANAEDTFTGFKLITAQSAGSSSEFTP